MIPGTIYSIIVAAYIRCACWLLVMFIRTLGELRSGGLEIHDTIVAAHFARVGCLMCVRTLVSCAADALEVLLGMYSYEFVAALFLYCSCPLLVSLL